jgi:hypothetical protein
MVSGQFTSYEGFIAAAARSVQIEFESRRNGGIISPSLQLRPEPKQDKKNRETADNADTRG